MDNAVTDEGAGPEQEKSSEESDQDTPEDFTDIAPFKPIRHDLLTMFNRVEERAELRLGIADLATGFHALDQLTGGLHRGNLILVAGAPGSGKSLFCSNIARQITASTDRKVAYFSLGANSELVAQRILLAASRVSANKLLTGLLDEDEWTRLAQVVQDIYGSGVFVTDQPHASVAGIWEACQKLSRKHDLDLVIIDSLPSISCIDTPPDVWDIARALKLMARALNIPVLATTHLYPSRTARNPYKRPVLGDLAGVECYADEVFLLHRPQEQAVTEPNTDAFYSEDIELLVSKQSAGPTGVVGLALLPNAALVLNHRDDEPTVF